jgi:hypothetical protein
MALPELLISNIKSCTDLTSPLSQYAIKGSYNSAVSGSYLSKEAIQYVINRGCRFVDFQVSYDVIYDVTQPTIFTPVVLNAKLTNIAQGELYSQNFISLDDALTTCITNAFSASNAPNYGDPFFIQLRILADMPSTLDEISNSIKRTLLPKLYTDSSGNAISVDKNTILNDIMGKIVLLVDITSLNKTNIDAIKAYINVFSNTTIWKKILYLSFDGLSKTPPQIKLNTDGSTTTDVVELSTLSPQYNNITPIPNPFSVFSEHGMQTLLVPFYSIQNPTLIVYEKLFNTVKGGVVPLATIVSYSNDMLGQIV